MKKVLFLFAVVLLALCSSVFALEKHDRSKSRCGIENCHGLDITCGENVPEVCTAMYALGDNCRRHAKCGVIDGKCVFIESKEFSECKSCIEKCLEISKDDIIAVFECESRCGLGAEDPIDED